MTPAARDALRDLLAQSLIAWRLGGEVRDADDGALVVSCASHDIRVAPAPPGLPFRWHVTIDGRTRPALSVVAVLRQVRAVLDPGYAGLRARVAIAPLVPT